MSRQGHRLRCSGQNKGFVKKKHWVLTAVLALIAVTAALLWSKQRQGQIWEKQLLAMDTVMTLTAYGPNGEAAVEQAAGELQRLDALWSVGNPDSEISALNAEGTRTVTAQTKALLERALSLSRETGGLFDASVYPLVTLWGFPTDHPGVPDAAEIDAVLPLVNSGNVALADDLVTLGPGQELDLGGIAKGYASARVMEIFRSCGVTSGIVSLGGNIQTLGAKPDGSLWRVGLRNPSGDAASYLGVLESRDQAIITSGGYERYFEEDGTIYIHILDPRTGWPAQSDLLSATVISADGTLADAFSTALFIMGSEKATEFWAARADQFDMILLTQDGRILITQGMASQFQTSLPVTVLSLN